MTIIYAIIIFLLLIFVHEFGHFIAAKACDVKVNEFALGMGPAFFLKRKGETLYSLRAIPIGGYCAMEGEAEDSDDERALNKKSGRQKFIIFFAGAGMNILLAVVIMVTIGIVQGSPTTTLGEVEKDMPAYEAGIEAGDIIVSIDGKEMESWSDITEFILNCEEKTIDITYLRDGIENTVPVNVYYNEKEKRNMLGIVTDLSHNPITGTITGFKATWAMTVSMFQGLGMLFSGQASMDDVSGPVGIVTIVGQTSSMGFIYVAYLTALISLNLAVINLLPFPALDGGRILFLFIRFITGRRVTDELENRFHLAGIVILLALMVFVTINDVGRLL